MTIAPRSAAVHSTESGPRSVSANRRQRLNMRELCDEVLASFRIAREREVLSDSDRQAARLVLAQLTPSLQR